MLAFCEKVALPCFLARDANPDLYAYLGYLKTQVEAKPCEGDFETIRVMGKGGFGLVKGCKTLRTGKMYALKEMDLKHKTSSKQEKESELANAKKDLKGTQEELDAALAYFEKLKPSCVDAGQSYEERVAERKAEIESLQDAMKILSGEA